MKENNYKDFCKNYGLKPSVAIDTPLLDSTSPDVETSIDNALTYMTTPEKSVEEIVEHNVREWEIYCVENDIPDLHRISFADILKRTLHFTLTQTLQAERQKRDKAFQRGLEKSQEVLDEMVAEERERIIHHWNKAEQRLDGTAQGAVNAIEQFRNFLTHPNNSK